MMRTMFEDGCTRAASPSGRAMFPHNLKVFIYQMMTYCLVPSAKAAVETAKKRSKKLDVHSGTNDGKIIEIPTAGHCYAVQFCNNDY